MQIPYFLYNINMIFKLINKLKRLSDKLLFLHFLAKLVLGIGIGVLLYQYLEGYGWWIVGLGLVMSFLGAWKAFQK